MLLHVAERQPPTDSNAKPLVQRVLELMGQVIEEGRITLKGLRSVETDSRDLAQSFSAIQDELSPPERIDYRVTIEGPSRPLHPSVRDEIYLIGREALLNAFRHSKANTIEVELEYGLKQLRILVRDDGRGIEPEVLVSGREGHWGLSGMRERAKVIGASLKLFSRAGAGTEVELSVPGRVAYEIDSSQRSRRWFGRVFRGGADSNESDKS
jgi:signal transduction histidine kinase